MAINNNLLIFSPTLQDFYEDKTGIPLANGVIYFYSNISRTTLKNVYYQSGTVEPYQYLPLPNPLTLSAAGSIIDVNGNDTLIGFYPFASDNQTVETYFIQAYDQLGTLQWTRYNFPIEPGGFGPTPQTGPFNAQNYIINNRFWRNLGTITIPTSGSSPSTMPGGLVICPSQHDGYTMADISFNVSTLGGGDVITFTKFPNSSTPALTGDITPEFYINHVCGTPTVESYKYYQFPISLHLDTLNATTAYVTIQARNNGGSSNVISLSLYPYQGTGNSTSTPIPFANQTLSGVWTKYTFTVSIPSDAAVPAAPGGDDALYLWVGLQTDVTCNINFALPSLYLTNEVPTNDFATYDQVNAIISSPRTGDIRTSLNSFYNWGWCPMNSGGIGNASSNATTRANIDTWPLFNLLWSTFSLYGSTIFPIYAAATPPTASTYGVSAIADWNANKSIALTDTMGQVILGTVPISALLDATPTILGYRSVVIASSSTGLLFTTATANLLNLYLGNTVTFSSTTVLVNVVANTIYYIIPISSTTFKIATTFANALARTPIAFVGAEGGTVTANLQLTNSIEGEYAHTQLLTELIPHTHSYTVPNSINQGNSGGAINAGSVTLAGTTGSTGGGLAMNVTQSGTFLNMYIKL